MEIQNKLTVENCSIEQLIASNTAKNLAKGLSLTETQIAKANQALLRLMTDEKLQGASQLSKLRYCYSVAQLNYKNDKAIVPVKYGSGVQAQAQYYAYIEDVIDTGLVNPKNIYAVPLFEKVSYKRYIDAHGNDIVEIPSKIELELFSKPKVIGYYAHIETNDGEIFTSLKSVEDLKKHALSYSISYKAFVDNRAKSAIWETNFDAMALKTVIKEACRKFIKLHPVDRLQNLIDIDQKVYEENGASYKDNPTNEIDSRKKTNISNTIIDLSEEENKAENVETKEEGKQ